MRRAQLQNVRESRRVLRVRSASGSLGLPGRADASANALRPLTLALEASAKHRKGQSAELKGRQIREALRSLRAPPMEA